MTTVWCFFLRGFHHQHRTWGMSHHRFGSRAEENSAQTSPAMRRNHDQVHFALFGDAHDFGGRFTVNNQFLDGEACTLVAFGEFRELALSRVFKLFRDVRDWQRFRHS